MGKDADGEGTACIWGWGQGPLLLRFLMTCLEVTIWADDMAQWVKALAAKTNNWSSIPRAHKVEEKSKHLQTVL